MGATLSSAFPLSLRQSVALTVSQSHSQSQSQSLAMTVSETVSLSLSRGSQLHNCQVWHRKRAAFVY